MLVLPVGPVMNIFGQVILIIVGIVRVKASNLNRRRKNGTKNEFGEDNTKTIKKNKKMNSSLF